MITDFFENPQACMADLENHFLNHLKNNTNGIADAARTQYEQNFPAEPPDGSSKVGLDGTFIFDDIPDFVFLWSKIHNVEIKLPVGLFYIDLDNTPDDPGFVVQIEVSGEISLFSEQMSVASRAVSMKFKFTKSIDFLTSDGPETTLEVELQAKTGTPVSLAGRGHISYTYSLSSLTTTEFGCDLALGYAADIKDLRVPFVQKALDHLGVEGEGSLMVVIGFDYEARTGHLDLRIALDFEATFEVEEELRLLGHNTGLQGAIAADLELELGTTLFDGVVDLDWRYEIKLEASASNAESEVAVVWEKEGQGEVEFSWSDIGEAILEIPSEVAKTWEQKVERPATRKFWESERELMWRLLPPDIWHLLYR